MLKKARLTFAIGFIVLAFIIGWAEYSFFKEVLAYKNSQIETLKEQLRSTKGEEHSPKPGESPTGSGGATTSGPQSPAVTGSGNDFSYGSPDSKKTDTAKHKKQ